MINFSVIYKNSVTKAFLEKFHVTLKVSAVNSFPYRAAGYLKSLSFRLRSEVQYPRIYQWLKRKAQELHQGFKTLLLQTEDSSTFVFIFRGLLERLESKRYVLIFLLSAFSGEFLMVLIRNPVFSYGLLLRVMIIAFLLFGWAKTRKR